MDLQCTHAVSKSFKKPIQWSILKYVLYLELLTQLDELTTKYGSPMRLWLGPELVVLISDADNNEIILKSKDCLNKPPSFYNIIRDAMQADGFFTLKGKVSKCILQIDFCCLIIKPSS